jgi:hypothetical protein
MTDGRPDAGPRGEMRDGIEFFSVKKQIHRCGISQIDSVYRDFPGDALNIRPLDLRIVKVVEVVENRDIVAGRE